MKAKLIIKKILALALAGVLVVFGGSLFMQSRGGSAPASAQNAFSARAYAEPEKTPDPVMNGEPQQPKQPEQPLYRDPSAGLRKDYNERPANKLDIPAFLRK